MKKKGFTLVELLVVIAIIAMLLAILMPALGKVRQLAYRMMCGTNLSGIGKAMMIYANDEDEEYPVGGKSGNTWSNTSSDLGDDWRNPNAYENFQSTDEITVSQSIYLLVKYADVSPAQFNCQGGNEKKFELDRTDSSAQNGVGANDAEDVTECWDFGGIKSNKGPWDYCSYSYQMPYGNYRASVSSSPGIALLADKNPLFEDTSDESPFDGTGNYTKGFFDISTKDDLDNNQLLKQGNAQVHQNEGQNVLFGDTHVEFTKTPNVGVQEDNIYTTHDTKDNLGIYNQIGKDPRTLTPGNKDCDSQAYEDSFLVNDGPAM